MRMYLVKILLVERHLNFRLPNILKLCFHTLFNFEKHVKGMSYIGPNFKFETENSHLHHLCFACQVVLTYIVGHPY